MLWKEEFCIGVEMIDRQHKELFDKVYELLNEINDSVDHRRDECIAAILFLKDYAVKHFAAEEAYQESIGYPEYEEHKKLHVKFVQSVLDHEKKMTASNFAEKDVKEFAGMLVTWLLYHVADTDQKIGGFVKKAKREQQQKIHTHSEFLQNSVFEVLLKMAGLEIKDMKKIETHDESFEGSVAILVELTQNLSGFIVLTYPMAFIKNLIQKIMGFIPETIDELVISALFEVSNIVSGKFCGLLASEKGIVGDITPPRMVTKSDAVPEEMFALDTGIGIVEAALVLN